MSYDILGLALKIFSAQITGTEDGGGGGNVFVTNYFD